MENSSLVLSWKNDQGLQGLGVPDVYQGVDVDLPGRSDSEERMVGYCRYLQLMPLVKCLLLSTGVVDNSYS
jgi:hypothetical protein